MFSCSPVKKHKLFPFFFPTVYELRGPGLDGRAKQFEKPWAMTGVMFLGMSLCLPIALVQDRRQRRRDAAAAAAGATAPLLGINAAPPHNHHFSVRDELRKAALLSVPTAFDLVATVLMNVGLLSVTVR